METMCHTDWTFINLLQVTCEQQITEVKPFIGNEIEYQKQLWNFGVYKKKLIHFHNQRVDFLCDLRSAEEQQNVATDYKSIHLKDT